MPDPRFTMLADDNSDEGAATFEPMIYTGPHKERLLTRAQVAEHLAISEATLDRLTASGELASVTIGRSCVRFTAAAVGAYVRSRRRTK